MADALSSLGTAINNAASYTAGQCTWYVARMLSWVPKGWGNAGEWVGHARAQGFQVSSAPVIGSIVGYAAGSGYSSFGHVGIVTSVNSDGTFNVSEMNATKGPFQQDERKSTMKGVQGFILPPNGVASGINEGAAELPKWITAPLTAFGVPDLTTLIERAGLIIVGLLLIVIGIAIMVRAPEKIVTAAAVMPK